MKDYNSDLPKAPFASLNEILVADFKEEDLVIRPLYKEEKAFLQSKLSSSESSSVSFSGPTWGQCTNKTGRMLGVYGTPSSEPYPYDSQLYFLPSDRTTPEGWDCDGFFVPNDRKVRDMSPSGLGRTWDGPVAVKISDWNEVTTRTVDLVIIEIANKPTDVLRSGQVRWQIPDVSQAVIDSRIPDVPQ